MEIKRMRTLVILFLLTYSGVTGWCQPVTAHGPLHVDGVYLKDSAGNKVALHGMSYGWHNFWPRFYNSESVSWLAGDWKCTAVRAAMGIEPKDGYKQKPEWSEKVVRSVIDGAIHNGLYVIIDWHSHNINLEEAKSFFRKMAETYGTRSNVIYELFNEPDKESWPEVKEYAAEIIKVIRAVDPDNVILVGCPHWDQDIDLVADAPLTGFSNIMYTVHFYAATHKQALRDKCDYALSKGIPIFISECAAMEATGDGPLNKEEWTRWTKWADEKKISWMAWSVSDKDESCSVLLPTANSNGNWSDKDLKEWGLLLRGALRSY